MFISRYEDFKFTAIRKNTLNNKEEILHERTEK